MSVGTGTLSCNVRGSSCEGRCLVNTVSFTPKDIKYRTLKFIKGTDES